jgi:hypothetical protein
MRGVFGLATGLSASQVDSVHGVSKNDSSSSNNNNNNNRSGSLDFLLTW